jgi:hypothetical protein
MKKWFAALLAATLVLTLSACKDDTPEDTENEAPVLTGIVAEVDIDLGQSWNALDGISATDAEDGDLTADIVISSIPALTFVDGVATPEDTGDYYITYAVTDSDGETTEGYTTLGVNAVMGEPVVFLDFEFVDGEADFNGFDVAFESPAAGSYAADKGVLSIDVTDNGDADWHAKLFKTGIEIVKGNTYEFTIRMKASEAVNAHFIINDAATGWAPYGGTWNLDITDAYADYTVEFLATTNSDNAEFLLQFGGDTFDDFTNPAAFTLDVDTISVTSTPTMISEVLHSDDFSTTDKGEFEVSIGETAVGTHSIADDVLTIDITNNGDADWHAKLFKTGIQIEQGATYTFTVNMKASEAINLHYIINNADAGWSPFVGSWNLDIGTEFADYTLEFLASEASTNAEFLVQFGGDTFDDFTNPEAFTLTIDSITITKSVAATVETEVISDDFEDGDTTGWAHRGAEGYSASIANVSNALSFQVDSYPTGNNPWEMDLYLATDYDLVNGTMYKLVFDYTTINDQFYELCFEDPTMDWQVRAGFKNGTLSGSGTLEYTFIASMDITDLHIKLSVGQGVAATNTLTIDNVSFYEIEGATESTTDTTDFNPAEGSTSWGTFNNNDEGAYGVVYVEDGKLVYDIEAFGATDWFNKLYFENVVLTGGGLYTLEFTIQADKTIEGLAGINVMGQWDPRIWEAITVTTEAQTFSFTMDAALLFEMEFEILFQFGFTSNEAPASIEFTNVTIYRQE